MCKKTCVYVIVGLILLNACGLFQQNNGSNNLPQTDGTPAGSGTGQYVEDYRHDASTGGSASIGNTWTAYSEDLTGHTSIQNAGGFGEALAYGNGVYVIVGGSYTSPAGAYGTIYSSSDAVTWTERTPTPNNQFNDLVWTGERFVAVGFDGIVAVSSDGITWQSYWIDGAPLHEINLKSVASNGSSVVAAGFGGVIYNSSTGLEGSWTEWVSQHPGTPNLIGPSFQRIIWDGWEYLLGGHHALDAATPVLWWSVSGEIGDWYTIEYPIGGSAGTWQPPLGMSINESVIRLARFGSDQSGVTVAATSGAPINSSTTGDSLLYSADWGVSWNNATVPAGISDLRISAMAVSPYRIIATTALNGEILSSSDGQSWTLVRDLDASLGFQDLIYAPDTAATGNYLFLGFTRGLNAAIWISTK